VKAIRVPKLFLPWGLLAILLLCLTGCRDRRPHASGINLLIGDAALTAYFGGPVPVSLDANERTRIHLRFVWELLSARSDARLADTERAARRENLARLAEYIELGEFPVNDGHPDRNRPVFIDGRGRICAVGYLFATARGYEMARRVAARHKYDFISEIDDPALLAWARASGLTLTELALIQPSYPSVVSQRHVPPALTLDPWDGETHIEALTGLEIGGPPGGVLTTTLSAEWLAFVHRGQHDGTGFGVGPYVMAGAAFPLGDNPLPTAFSNTDVGMLHVSEHPDWGRLVLRAGAILPTAPTRPDARTLNARAVVPRVTDGVLRLPKASGARLSASPVFIIECLPYDTLGAPNGCALRLDGGADLYSSDGAPMRAAPRLNAAIGAWAPGGAFYLESATTYFPLSFASPALHSTLGGSVRFRLTRRRWYAPLQVGVGAVLPLTPELHGWSMLFDLRVTAGPATRFECC
jgi:hypothetical protein